MLISSINVNANLIQWRELKDNASFRFCHQTYNWKMPHLILSLNVWWIELRQHTIFTVVTDKTLWSRKCSRSAVFLKKHLCGNKRKRSLVRFLSIFSNVFVWASRRRAIEILQYLIRSCLCLIIGHDVIINEILKSNYLSLYVANLTVSSKTLLNSIPYLRISMNKLGSDWLS